MKIFNLYLFALALTLLAGCATNYVTPGAPANLAAINRPEIRELVERKPAPQFPARLATIRVQAGGYRSHSLQGIGTGKLSVVTVRELMSEALLSTISEWPQVAAIAPINRLLLPAHLETVDDLRLAAAKVQADMLLVYTVDTSFRVQGKWFSSLAILSLGLAPDREARVTATASALLVDVRTGFIYGLAESTAKAKQLTNAWSSADTVDNQRLAAEREAFHDLVQAMGSTWQQIVANYRKEDIARD